MKKSIFKMALGAISLGCFYQSNAQSTISGIGTGHAALPIPALYWNGWDAGTTIPFNIEHRGGAAGQTINFLTNSIQRMTITNGNGFVGIGTTAPNNILHINDGVNAMLQITNATTGVSATNGMLVGLYNNTNNAFIANQQNAPLFFATNGAATPTVRMTVLGGAVGGPTTGFVGIGTGFTAPTSLLHLQTITTGSIFRSDGLQTLDNKWQMYTGTTAANVTEKGRLYTTKSGAINNYAVVNDFNIKATSGSLFLQSKNSGGSGYQVIIDSTNGYMGISGNPGITFGPVYTTAAPPDMPLTISGDWSTTKKINNEGWARGIHMQNFASIVWDNLQDGTPNTNYIFMGSPADGSDASFYCGLMPSISPTAPTNYSFRIINAPVPLQTSIKSGDLEFFHSVLVDTCIGVGMNSTCYPITIFINLATG